MKANASPRVLHLSLSARRGGAATAAWRLHRSLIEQDVDSRMLVSETDGCGPSDGVTGPMPVFGSLLQRLRKNFEIHVSGVVLRPKVSIFSPACAGAHWDRVIARLRPEVVHLHWVNYGHLRPEALARWNLPIIWTLHDQWPFTGGCHFAGSCRRFEAGCGHCPQLGSPGENDASASLFRRKQAAWRTVDLTITAPSTWMARQAAKSALFSHRSIHTIPYGVDLATFAPLERGAIRRELEIEDNRPVLLFAAANAASDPRKGFHLLREALLRLHTQQADSFQLLVAGDAEASFAKLPFEVKNLGKVATPAAMAKVYNAADAFVIASLEDNLPNTVLESLASGTPVIGLPSGGIPDMVEDGINGYLASSRDPEALASTVSNFFAHPNVWPAQRQAARTTAVSRFGPELQAERMLGLYRRVLTR
jgi:glycosyltransferase involved in cell wall biosynthesis